MARISALGALLAGFGLCTAQTTSFSSATAATATTASSSTSTSATYTGTKESPVVEIDTYGYVQGNRSQYINSVYNFLNMPYGGAPTGTSRWIHTPHPTAWSELRDATTFGPACPQPGVDNYDEDCLHLNVWTPDNATLNDVYTETGVVGVLPNATNTKYPVYVYIYDSGFVSGSTSDPKYDGAGLAAKGVVVVTMNYRLGALAWLATPELSDESGTNSSGNYAIVDQQAALHWVNERIASFGGDPTRITIGGQAAGAALAVDHLSSPDADGLFEQIIAESGVRYPSDPMLPGLAQGYNTLAKAEQQGTAFLKNVLNVSTIAEARNVSVEAFLSSNTMRDETVFAGTVFENNSNYHAPPLFRPVLDGVSLPATYEQLLEQGTHTIAPILTGNNANENGASAAPGLTASSYKAANAALFGNLSTEFLELYPAGASADNASNAFYRDLSRVGTWMWANEYGAGSFANTSGDGNYSVYTYYWNHSPPGQDEGASHGSEVNYALNNLYATDKAWTSADYEIADKMSDYWVNFLRSGNPNGGSLKHWPANSANASNTFELGDAFSTVPVADSEDKISFIKKWFGQNKAY